MEQNDREVVEIFPFNYWKEREYEHCYKGSTLPRFEMCFWTETDRSTYFIQVAEISLDSPIFFFCDATAIVVAATGNQKDLCFFPRELLMKSPRLSHGGLLSPFTQELTCF